MIVYAFILIKEVEWPSITICNLNQLEVSTLKKLDDAFNTSSKTDSIVNEYLANQEENYLGQELFVGASYATKLWRQSCRDLVISMSFRENFLSWKELSPNKTDEEEFNNIGPSYYPTDFGACCLFVPHLDFQSAKENVSYQDRYHGLTADAQSGRINGLQLLLDAEQFNYGDIPISDGVGFKVALNHHLDKPMMQYSSQLISVGTETQINLAPTISYTTSDAISTLKPEERDCYANGEVNLTYLPYSSGFHYSMNNCIIDELLTFILWECRCIPPFASSWIAKKYESHHDIVWLCQGEKLYCANRKINSLKKERENITTIKNSITLGKLKNTEKVGNISKPASIKCRPSCTVQENINQMSSVFYPQKRNFFYRKNFCHVSSHVLQITCRDEDRKHFLDLEYPGFCETLQYFEKYFGKNSSCDNWPENFLNENDNKPNKTLMEHLFKYGRSSLSIVRVMIQSPHVTKIKRDLAMTITNYVANTGGLLGLCLGFSFISGIEVLFWICCLCQEVWKNVRNLARVNGKMAIKKTIKT